MTIGTPNFPATLDTATTLMRVVNNASGVLDTPGIDADDVIIPMISTALAPSDGVAWIEDEAISYTGKTSTTLTGCSRGFDGTTPAVHATGTPVSFDMITSAHHEALRDAIIATETKLGSGADTPLVNEALVGTGTGTSGWRALVKGDVGLSNVDNTSDASKPVSTAQATAIGLKANAASPVFTGTVTLPTGLTGVVRADAGVVSVDTDVTDIVAAASATAQGKVELATTVETTTGTDTVRAVTPAGLHDMTSLAGAAWFVDEDAMTSNLDTKVPSQQSVKAYVDNQVRTIVQSVVIPFGDGVNVITVGDKRRFSLPMAHTLIRWRILSSISGSIVFDVWRDTLANYPPVVGDSIATSKPTLSAATTAEDSTITDWNEVGVAGDVYIINVDSVTTCTDVVLELWYTRTV